MIPELLDACTGCGIVVAKEWAEVVSYAMASCDAVTPLRQAAYLAQVAYESGGFTHLEENLNYSAEGLLKNFPHEFDQISASDYAGFPIRIANRAYANKYGNRDEDSGDGWNMRGSGHIQITFTENYKAYGDYLGRNFLAQPDLVRTNQEYAARTAEFYWRTRNLNALADKQDFHGITKAINPGMAGVEGRAALYARARGALALDLWTPADL